MGTRKLLARQPGKRPVREPEAKERVEDERTERKRRRRLAARECTQEHARMRERQKLDEDAHDLGQSLRREERAAEERHRQQDVCIDLPHLFVRLDLHRRDEADLRKDHAVQHEHEEKERGERELRAEKAGERNDDGRGNESA